MSVEDFFYEFEGEQQKIMLFLHEKLTDEFQLTAKLRYKIPFYFRLSWICYINPTKDNRVEFAFIRGNEMSNFQNILESKGRKLVYSLTVEKLSDLPIDLLNEVILEAITLDEMKPYASKRKS